MAKTLNHYSQQIRALAPDALALKQARDLGLLLIEAKAAVQAAGRKWGEWLERDCSLGSRTAQRFMTVARRWDEPAFIEARKARPGLPLREADKVLAATSSRKKPEPVDPIQEGYSKAVSLAWELQQLLWDRRVDQVAGDQLAAAAAALGAARSALFIHAHGEAMARACSELPGQSGCRRLEMAVGDRCDCSAPYGPISGTITAVHPDPSGDWSTYSWLQDGTDEPVTVGWGMPGAAAGLKHSIAVPG